MVFHLINFYQLCKIFYLNYYLNFPLDIFGIVNYINLLLCAIVSHIKFLLQTSNVKLDS